jgi:hypothetical protein
LGKELASTSGTIATSAGPQLHLEQSHSAAAHPNADDARISSREVLVAVTQFHSGKARSPQNEVAMLQALLSG